MLWSYYNIRTCINLLAYLTNMYVYICGFCICTYILTGSILGSSKTERR
nr:MAG TPA: hypothetical protein [Caudoviricetes sp.]